ncbi:hypothetical protein G9A89_022853 [Geosiphon pyriformis]|nr:hypothetical protein G9A89_022853 [Geosiphon pyriformis]
MFHEDEDDIPTLSLDTLSALQEFLTDQEKANKIFERLRARSEARFISEKGDLKDDEEVLDDLEIKDQLIMEDDMNLFKEDWQLSQFWYDDTTSQTIATEILKNFVAYAGDQDKLKHQSNNDYRIACISTPTIFVKLKGLIQSSTYNGCIPQPYLFEFDKRFDIYGKNFIHYDYKKPIKFHDADRLKGAFDYIVIDPPFLSEECFTKTMITTRWLANQGCKILVCTGKVMADLVKRLIDARMTNFIPQHKGGLANEFRCFTNYKSDQLEFNTLSQSQSFQNAKHFSQKARFFTHFQAKFYRFTARKGIFA